MKNRTVFYGFKKKKQEATQEDSVALWMLSALVEVRSAGDAGNGCFAARGGGSDEQGIPAGTTVLEGARPLVWAVNDKHETRNCRSDVKPDFVHLVAPLSLVHVSHAMRRPRALAQALFSRKA